MTPAFLADRAAPGSRRHDPDLLEQHDLLVVLADAALDHLLDDRLGLAGGARLLGQHRPLALQRRRIDAGDVERLGPGGGDVHADLPAERLQRRQLAVAFDADQHADLAEARASAALWT